MQPARNDPGFGEKYFSRTKRIINPDGSFNIVKRGIGFSPRDMYQFLINLSWPRFMGFVVIFYILVNCFFALLYLFTGVEYVEGAKADSLVHSFTNLFFFSVQTITTVGYGLMVPKSILSNVIVTFETLTGLLGFALTTGLLYGRFSRPSSRILYSRNALITSYQDRTSFQFRIANKRRNTLMEIEARVMVAFIEKIDGQSIRRYYDMALERSYIYFFPLSWTIVHPIDKDSPFFGKTMADLKALEAEILILIKGFDDTFSQVVHSRYSYRFDEIIWGAKFTRAFFINDDGDVIIDLDELHGYELNTD